MSRRARARSPLCARAPDRRGRAAAPAAIAAVVAGVIAAVVAGAIAAVAPALADPAEPGSGAAPRVRLAAVVAGPPGSDVTRAVLVGPSGELYEPGAGPGDDRRPRPGASAAQAPALAAGSWRRMRAGGVAADVIGARTGPDGSLVVAGAATPLYSLDADMWHARPLPNRGAVRLASTGALAVAIGGHVYTARERAWARLARAPGAVSAVWAPSADTAYVALAAGGLVRLQRGAVKRVRMPAGLEPPRRRPGARTRPRGDGAEQAAVDIVIALVGAPGKQPYAITAGGLVLSVTPGRASPIALPAGLGPLSLHAGSAAPGGDIWLAGRAAPAIGAAAATPPGAPDASDRSPGRSRPGSGAGIAPGAPPPGASSDRASGADTSGASVSVAATPTSGHPVLVHVSGRIATLVPAPPLEPGDRFAGVHADGRGGLLVASARGAVWIRENAGNWRPGAVDFDLGDAGRAHLRPGARPAATR